MLFPHYEAANQWHIRIYCTTSKIRYTLKTINVFVLDDRVIEIELATMLKYLGVLQLYTKVPATPLIVNQEGSFICDGSWIS